MKIRTVEFFVAVAIISSAAAMQIREHMHPQVTPEADSAVAASLCGAVRNGVAPASCEATRSDEHRPAAPALEAPRSASQVWV